MLHVDTPSIIIYDTGDNVEVDCVAPLDPLTNRELDVLTLLSKGHTNREVAEHLFLEITTVKWYCRQIYSKLDVKNRSQAIICAQSLGLLDDASDSTASADATISLPEHNTPFVGRVGEIEALGDRLRDPDCRLLTLSGPGGVGKTRLSIEAARNAQADFSDGVVFVPLAPIDTPGMISTAVADALRLQLDVHDDVMPKLLSYLKTKSLLLILDNVEHLLNGVGIIDELISATQNLVILVTTRERLKLSMEWVFDVIGLSYPRNGVVLSDDIAEFDAVQLFLQTSHRVETQFAPTQQDYAAIAKICALVEGMPLAIELAASWIRALTCADIVDEIKNDTEILQMNWSDMPDRHRSIQAVIDHSWAMLTAGEREAFSRLTVFVGNFTREAARSVAGATIPTLLSLIDKSFINRGDGGNFTIHQLLKQYGYKRLEDDVDVLASTRESHCRYFASYVQLFSEFPLGRDELTRFDAALEDVQVAWHFAIEHDLKSEAVVLTDNLRGYYDVHGWGRAGDDALQVYNRLVKKTTKTADNLDDHHLLSLFHEGIGSLHLLNANGNSAIAAYQKALEVGRLQDVVGQARVIKKAGHVYMVLLHDHQEAHQLYDEAQSILESSALEDDAWWKQWLDINLDRLNLYYWQHRPDEMQGLLEIVQPHIQAHGSVMQQALYAGQYALMDIRRTREFFPVKGVVRMRHAMNLEMELGNQYFICRSTFTLGFMELMCWRLDEAEDLMQRAWEIARQTGDVLHTTRILVYLSVVYRLRGDIEGCHELAESGLQASLELNMLHYAGLMHGQLAWVAYRNDDMTSAAKHGQQCLEYWNSLGEKMSILGIRWPTLITLIALAVNDDDIPRAVELTQMLRNPSQQRLLDDLDNALSLVIEADAIGNVDATRHYLDEALGVANNLNYL